MGKDAAVAQEARRRRWLGPSVLVTVVALLGLVPLAAITHGTDPSDEAPAALTAGSAAAMGQRPRAARATLFAVASFNVLGWKHTARGGRKAAWPDGRKRMLRTHRLLKRHGIDVVGFQELQPEQLETFQKVTRRRWAVYPGGRFENIAMHNSIAWRKVVWERKELDYLQVPYFWGDRVKMPVIELRHRRTGRVVRFANFHNPSDGKGDAQRWRNQARRMQVRLANDSTRRLPLIITGDMNEGRRYFCRMVGRAPMHAANGGRATRKRCVPPKPMGIDWIFGSKAIRFRWYERIEKERIVPTSDHPFVAAGVKVRPRHR